MGLCYEQLASLHTKKVRWGIEWLCKGNPKREEESQASSIWKEAKLLLWISLEIYVYVCMCGCMYGYVIYMYKKTITKRTSHFIFIDGAMARSSLATSENVGLLDGSPDQHCSIRLLHPGSHQFGIDGRNVLFTIPADAKQTKNMPKSLCPNNERIPIYQIRKG